jgi:hypothetical protein
VHHVVTDCGHHKAGTLEAAVFDVEWCLHQMMSLGGARGASLVDCPSESVLGAQGWTSDRASSAVAAARVVRATMQMCALTSIGRSDEVEGITVAARNGYHLLRLVPPPRGGRLMLHVWLDRTTGNLDTTQQNMNGILTDFCAK